ncbi:uncharacterized protein [Euwallacea fornicatus]|uniref:uncharacterized protein n=1 Tax=Euwallacea fornicatus TaxID=995702 RepID=UPI00338E2BBD
MNGLRMSDSETLKFLEYYRNEPSLWDPINEGYKKKEARTAAASRIAEALNLPNFTTAHVNNKFKNLRSSYAQELKKISGSAKSGASTGDVYVPKVVWFKQMDAFLKPHVKSRATLSKLRRAPEEVCIKINANCAKTECPQSNIQFQGRHTPTEPGPSIEQSAYLVQREKQSIELQSHFTRAASATNCKSRSSPEPCLGTPSKRLPLNNRVIQKKRHIEYEAPEVIMAAMEKLDKISERVICKEDNFDHFGRYITSLLRSLPKQKALKLQQEIITRVLNAHMSISNSSSFTNLNYQIDADVFSPPSTTQESWISELPTAMDSYSETK